VPPRCLCLRMRRQPMFWRSSFALGYQSSSECAEWSVMTECVRLLWLKTSPTCFLLAPAHYPCFVVFWLLETPIFGGTQPLLGAWGHLILTRGLGTSHPSTTNRFKTYPSSPRVQRGRWQMPKTRKASSWGACPTTGRCQVSLQLCTTRPCRR